jgi:hypothetical protein
MIIEKFESFYIVNKISEHKIIKNKLLNFINDIPSNSINTINESIKHTDWNLPKSFERKYLNFFLEIINPYMIKMMKFLKTEKYIIDNIWFQQYTKNDFHNWHVHENSNYTNVYYLELPEKEMKTNILNINTNKIIEIDVEEGDVITFPAHLPHTSNIIKNDKRKTIISFNSNFLGVNLNGN